MKKITSIILAIALTASLTACSAADNEPKNDTGSGTNSTVQPDTGSNTDDASDESKDNVSGDKTSDDKTDSTPEDGASDDKTDSDPEDSKKPEDKNEDKSDSKTDSKTDDKTEDNKDGAADSKTDNKTDGKVTALPLKDYPAGSYFTYDGKPCTDHKNCDWTSKCNCVNFDLSIQSVGFAKYVYYQVTGKHVSLDNKTEKDIDLTAESAKTSLQGLPLGTYVAVQTSNDYFHTVIVTDTNEAGISIYQANYGGGCVVSTATYSWADFAKRFPHLHYYIK